jgi:ABC-type dipeptide/oligopeptide/nickel transport system permease subunit
MDSISAQPSSIARLSPDELETPPLSLRQLAWRRFRRHKMAMFGGITLILLFIYSFGGALFVSEKYANQTDTKLRLNAPSEEHLFGTDTVGRDSLARTIYGGQISILIGLAAVIIETLLGILVGALAGIYGGMLDNILMRITEAMLNIPELFLLIVMAKNFGGKIPNINSIRT